MSNLFNVADIVVSQTPNPDAPQPSDKAALRNASVIRHIAGMLVSSMFVAKTGSTPEIGGAAELFAKMTSHSTYAVARHTLDIGEVGLLANLDLAIATSGGSATNIIHTVNIDILQPPPEIHQPLNALGNFKLKVRLDQDMEDVWTIGSINANAILEQDDLDARQLAYLLTWLKRSYSLSSSVFTSNQAAFMSLSTTNLTDIVDTSKDVRLVPANWIIVNEPLV